MIYENEIRPKVRVMTVTTEGAEVDIRNASFPKPFHIGLQYASPARGHWTIAHSPYLIPQCHQVYVCCACCLHGVVLSADEVEGGAERFSTVTVTNENIIKGNLEEMMIDGIAHIIESLPEEPRCVEGFTSCIQHFLHIDIRLVYDELRKKFPRIDFIDGYMIPTLQRRYSPDVLGRRQLMRAVTNRPKRKKVNFIVNYYPVDQESELVQMLIQAGWEIGDFAACKTYDEYRDLGAARAELFFLENARPAAEDAAKRLEQEAVYLPYSYSLSEIRRNLETAAKRFDAVMPDCEAYERAIEEKAALLKERLDGMRVAIDYSATPRPLSLARFLLTHGINVFAVYLDTIAAIEEAEFNFLQARFPALSLRSTMHYKRRLLPRDEALKNGPVLAIGQKAAYFTGTKRFVNLIENSGLYGYTGMLKLMDMMTDAAKTDKDVASIIQVKAWGCRA